MRRPRVDVIIPSKERAVRIPCEIFISAYDPHYLKLNFEEQQKMKKSLIAIWSIMLLSVLVGCGGSGDSTPTPESTYDISGTISVSGGGALPGVTVTLSGAGSETSTTDASGKYTFAGLSNGLYTITPTVSGYEFNPVSQTLAVNGTAATDMNFTATPEWALTTFPAYLYGDWYNDADGGSWQWGITGSTTIRTYNRFFSVQATYVGPTGEYKVITTEGVQWYPFFFKNITATHMQAAFAGSSPTGFSTQTEAFQAIPFYSRGSGHHK
jgi:hypothetical protein